jgi:hypothetical protein
MTTPQKVSLDDVVDEFRRHLFLPDLGLLYVVLATVVANRMEGDPVWMLLVGASSSGKSEMLNALKLLPEYHAISTFTEAGLLSGSSMGSPGLLQNMGDRGLMVFSDLTTILSKHRTDSEGVLGSLREVYDGSYMRWLGTGPRRWEGHVGLLAGVTEMIDGYDLGQLGERMLRFRLPQLNEEEHDQMSAMVLDDNHKAQIFRKSRAQIVARFFADLDPPESPPELTVQDKERLSVLATLGTRCRSSVVRDRYKGDVIERVPAPEGLGRMLGQLDRLAGGLRVLGVPEDEVWRVIAQVALDGMHPLRRRVLEVLIERDDVMSTASIAGHCALPHTSVRRHLEDLRAHGVLDLVSEGPETWSVSAWTKERWWTASESK